MVYIIPIPFIFIYWTVGITSSVWFVLRCWKSIIINSVAIFQNRNYILLSHFMNMSLMAIGFNRTPLPSLLLIFTIFEHMCLTTLSIDSNPHLNTVQLMFCKFLIFYEIYICSLLVTVTNSLRIISIPQSTSHLSLLGYLSETNLTGWRYRSRAKHGEPTPHLFFCGWFKTFRHC